jgi:hypothetical protein
MCIQRDGISIYGENGSDDIRTIFFNISACNPATSTKCATQTDIDNYMSNNLTLGKYFACSIIILDTGINPTK